MEETTQETKVEVTGEEDQHETESTFKRANGKKLRRIRHQMEFYFSNANLCRDRMLGKMIQQSTHGYVDLKIFLTFNKIKSMTDRIEDLIKAVSQSTQLELDEDQTKVSRKFPFLFQSRNTEALTVYAERIPAHADHKFVKNVFQRFGKVAYVSLPFFRNSNKNKGFAFIEFESEQAAKLACESYKECNEEENGTHDATGDESDIKEENKDFNGVQTSKNTTHRSRKHKKGAAVDEPTEQIVKEEVEDFDSGQTIKSTTLHSRKHRKSENVKEPTDLPVKENSGDFNMHLTSIPHHSKKHKEGEDTEDLANPDAKEESKDFSSVQTASATPHSRKRKKCETAEDPAHSDVKEGNEDFNSMKAERNTTLLSRKHKKLENAEEPPVKIFKVESAKESSTENLSKLQKQNHHSSNHARKRRRQNSESETPPKKSKGSSKTKVSTDLPKPNLCVSSSTVEPEADADKPKTLASIKDMSELHDSSANAESTGKTEVADVVTNGKEQIKSKRRRKKDSEKLQLRVMTMAEWKMHRNQYLTMQRKAMSAIKKMLLIDQQQRDECESVLCHPSTSKERLKAQHCESKAPDEKGSEMKFQQGVILRILVSEGSDKFDPKELREQIKASVLDVAYVDTTTLNELKIFIRFFNQESAETAVTNELLNKIGSCEIISGDDETSYWEKAKLDRTAQRNRQRPKIRGRDKILAKSAKLLGKK